MTRKTKSEATRQTILSTGRRLVIKGGFGAMGLSALLKECGIPKGSFYHYFASKEAFGQAMLHDYVEDYITRVDAILAGQGTGAAKLLAFCTAWLDHDGTAGVVRNCLVVNLGAEVADLSDAMRQVLDDGVRELVARIASMMRAGVADGSLRLEGPPENAARLLYAQLLGAAILTKLSQDQGPLEAVLNDIETRLVISA